MVGSTWYVLTIVSIWDHWIYDTHFNDLNFLLILNCGLIVVLIMFNTWHWYLAFSGTTTVEFWKYHASYTSVPYDFSFDLVRDNLFNIFGTYKLVRQFSPSLRSVPLTGLEWSFILKDRGIAEDGEVDINQLHLMPDFPTIPEASAPVEESH